MGAQLATSSRMALHGHSPSSAKVQILFLLDKSGRGIGEAMEGHRLTDKIFTKWGFEVVDVLGRFN